MKTALVILFVFLLPLAVAAQFAPQAGVAGSTAIPASSSVFTAWAAHCSVQRGYIDVANPPAGYTTAGDTANATGIADGSILSLGDSGVAILSFAAAIYNGPGADFAVFENGFKDPADATMAFLELAFVEVSSDGSHYVRFPAVSNTPANTQIPGSGVYMDASLVNNLAGKYIANYGTPFDLEELAGQDGLDVSHITHIRIVDVIGAVSTHSCTDNEGKIINDPYPTNFPTGGFDLDAVAAIHSYSSGIAIPGGIAAQVYPNPATDKITITTTAPAAAQLHATITSLSGGVLMHAAITGNTATLSLSAYPAGMYYITISDTEGSKWIGKIVKY